MKGIQQKSFVVQSELSEGCKIPAPKHALLSNIFNEELSELRIVADITTRKAKINRLLPIVSAMLIVLSKIASVECSKCVGESNVAYRIELSTHAFPVGDDSMIRLKSDTLTTHAASTSLTRTYNVVTG